MKKVLFFTLIMSFHTLHAENSVNSFNDDLIYDKLDKQTPSNVNDDHMTVRKIRKGEEKNLAVSGGNIYFEIDKAIINNTEHIKIEEMAKVLTKISSRLEKVAVEGFASQDGDPNRNFDLGIERAKAVKKALIKLGLSADKIETYSYGEDSMYKFTNVNKNRRAQIKIFIKK